MKQIIMQVKQIKLCLIKKDKLFYHFLMCPKMNLCPFRADTKSATAKMFNVSVAFLFIVYTRAPCAGI